jgi:nuclear cap-binding protein subunit 1
VDRFASWFAYHLSNFQFRWSWDDWSNALTLDPLHPKPKFIRETLLRCMRLSYHHQVIDSIPDSFREFAPELPAPENKYTKEGADSLPGTAIALTLMNAIKEKCTPEEALSIIKELPNPLMETEDGMNSLQII